MLKYQLIGPVQAEVIAVRTTNEGAFEATIEELRLEIVEYGKVKTELERLLADHRAVIVDLRGELRNRWPNLKRALRRKIPEAGV